MNSDKVVEESGAGENLMSEEMEGVKNGEESGKIYGRKDEDTSGCSPRKATKKISLYVAVLSAVLLVEMMLSTYNVGVVRTLEKRFSLTSKQSALIFTMNDIAHISICMFVAYFGDRYHKPRLIGLGTLLIAIGSFLMAAPALIAEEESAPAVGPPTAGIMANYTRGMCNLGIPSRPCSSSASAVDGSSKAIIIFCIGMLFNGVGGSAFSSVGISYIDDNASPTRTSFYIGIVTSMYALGPMLGFLVAALTLSFPEYPWKGTTLGTRDPSYIGCWWSGYVFFGAFVLIASIPLWFFPKQMTSKYNKIKDEQEEDHIKEKPVHKESVKDQIKAFPRSLLRLLENKAYVSMLVFSVALSYLVLGIFAGLTRYLEIHFRYPAFSSAVITALDSALAGAIGAMAGGIFMSKRKLGAVASSKLLVVSWAAVMVGLLILLFIGCHQPPLSGEFKDDGFSVSNSCNQNCSCITTSRRSFRPVCGSDGSTYYSACHAGCTENFRNGTYGSCMCVSEASKWSNFTMAAPIEMGTASEGVCGKACRTIIPFAVVMFIMCMLGSVCRVPITTVQLRIVKETDRSFALGFNSFAYNLLGFIPAPVLYGALIDSSCKLWQKTCSSSGVCLAYDTTRMRQLTYGVTLGIQFIAFLATIALVVFVKRMNLDMQRSHKDKKPVVMEVGTGSDDNPRLKTDTSHM